jgi:acyl-CoA synthetase (AMP-forming)/AMP-acid ligase II
MAKSVHDFSTVVGLLRYRYLEQLNTEGFTFLQDGEVQAKCLTYNELDHQSRALAEALTCKFASRIQALG